MNIKNHLTLILKGFCMGAANAIPGISGGTIAFLCGIYEQLINAIKSFDVEFFLLVIKGKWKDAFSKIPFKFLATLFFGVILAIVTLSRIITWLLEHKPIFINSFFFGLILATIPIIARVIKKWTFPKAIFFILAAVFTYILGRMIPVSTPDSAWFIFICGVIAISTMILPGISGAFVLVLLGKYQYILEAINNRDLNVIVIFTLGMVIGIVSFVRILSWLFKKWHDITVAVLSGIVAGSLDKIWPWKITTQFLTTHKGKIIPLEQINQIPSVNQELLIAVILMVTGLILAFALNTSDSDKIL